MHMGHFLLRAHPQPCRKMRVLSAALLSPTWRATGLCRRPVRRPIVQVLRTRTARERIMDGQKPLPASPQQSIAPGTLTVRPLLLKPQWMNGLSERLLVSHYVNNYGGALRRLNAIRERLARLDWSRTPTFEINGLKREELIAAGSVVLHEVYFDSLGGQGDNPPTGRTE